MGNLDDLSRSHSITDRSQYISPRERQNMPYGSLPNIKEPMSAYRPAEVIQRNYFQLNHSDSYSMPNGSQTTRNNPTYRPGYPVQGLHTLSRAPTLDYSNHYGPYQNYQNLPSMGPYSPTHNFQGMGYYNYPAPMVPIQKKSSQHELENKLDKQNAVLETLVLKLDKQIAAHSKAKEAASAGIKRPSQLGVSVVHKRPSQLGNSVSITGKRPSQLVVSASLKRPSQLVIQKRAQPELNPSVTQQKGQNREKDFEQESPKTDKYSLTNILCEVLMEKLIPGQSIDAEMISSGLLSPVKSPTKGLKNISEPSSELPKKKVKKIVKKKKKTKKVISPEGSEDDEEEAGDLVNELKDNHDVKQAIGAYFKKSQPQQVQQKLHKGQSSLQELPKQSEPQPYNPYPILQNLNSIPLTTPRKQQQYASSRPRSYMDFEYTRSRSIEDSDSDDSMEKKKERPKLKKKTIKERRKDAKSRVRVTCWSLTFPILLSFAVKHKVLVEREGFLKVISHNISSSHTLLETFILEKVGTHIKKMLIDKNYSFIFVTKKLTDSKLDKECKALMTYFKDILNELINHTRGLPIDFFRFLATLSEENSNVPNDYFTDFELKRQQFNFFGKLKGMNPVRSKLIIGGVVLRVFVQKLIMKPWELYDIELKKVNQERLLNIGSVIYNLMMEVFENYMPPFKDNQSFLPVELKIRPKKAFPQAIEPDILDPKLKGKTNPSIERQIIEGFYSKEQLACFFSERKGIVNEAKARIDDWLEQFYQISHEEFEKKN